MATVATAPPVDPAAWSFGISDARKAQRAAPTPLAADGAVEAIDGLAEAAPVGAAGDGLPACGEAVALPPQAAVFARRRG